VTTLFPPIGVSTSLTQIGKKIRKVWYASYGYTETFFYLSQDMRGTHIHREHRQDQTEETLREAMNETNGMEAKDGGRNARRNVGGSEGRRESGAGGGKRLILGLDN
jgi:hypothetical protein